MKILYHHRTASADGQSVHIEELIAALRALGHEIYIVAPGSSSNTGQMGHKLGWVHNLKAFMPKIAYELMELAYSVVAYRRLAKAVHIFKPDVLYERYNLYMIAGALIHRRFELPFILEVNSPLVYERTRHGGLGLPALAKWAEGMVWRSANYLLPVTWVLAEHALAYGVPRERIIVIPNGINRSQFANAPSPEMAKAELGLAGRLVLGFTGFVRDWHGVDKVIQWMAGGTAPENCYLLVVGDGPARTQLEQLAQSLGLSNRISFTGTISREEIPQHVATFDIALQPAVVEYASPLKLFEYLALGKAIIAPNTPNLREILEDGHNALLFSPDEKGSMEAVLDRLCNHPDLRTGLGEGARATIDKRDLTWHGNAEKVEALGKQMMNQNTKVHD